MFFSFCRVSAMPQRWDTEKMPVLKKSTTGNLPSGAGTVFSPESHTEFSVAFPADMPESGRQESI